MNCYSQRILKAIEAQESRQCPYMDLFGDVFAIFIVDAPNHTQALFDELLQAFINVGRDDPFAVMDRKMHIALLLVHFSDEDLEELFHI